MPSFYSVPDLHFAKILKSIQAFLHAKHLHTNCRQGSILLYNIIKRHIKKHITHTRSTQTCHIFLIILIDAMATLTIK